MPDILKRTIHRTNTIPNLSVKREHKSEPKMNAEHSEANYSRNQHYPTLAGAQIRSTNQNDSTIYKVLNSGVGWLGVETLLH
jgi:hypothetical protein